MREAVESSESNYEKTYGSERYCFKEAGPLKCYSSIVEDGVIKTGAFYLCGQHHSEASMSPQNKVESGCEKESYFK